MKIFMTVVLDKIDVPEEGRVEEEKLKEEMDQHCHVMALIEIVYNLVQDDIPVQLRITNLPPRSTEYTRASDI